MRTKDEIKEAIRSNLPFRFRVSDSVEFSEIKKRYREVSEYAYKIAESFLNKETIRYQSILLYVSLICLSVYFFDFSSLKVFEHDVEIDKTFLVLFTLFIVIITITFSTKAIIDYKTKQIARQRDAFSLFEANNLLNIGLLKVMLDEYYWSKIYNVIGKAFKTFLDVTATARGDSSNYEHPDIQTVRLDLDELRKTPDMQGLIKSREEFLSDVLKQIESDQLLFRQRADKILKETEEQKKSMSEPLFHLDDSFWRITQVFDETLNKWLDARKELTSEYFSTAFADNPELARSELFVGLLNKSKRIKYVTVFLEVVLPILFAVLTLMVVWIEEIFF